jgi:hypothetical protein
MFQAFTRTLLRRYQAAAMVLVVGTSLFGGLRSSVFGLFYRSDV